MRMNSPNRTEEKDTEDVETAKHDYIEREEEEKRAKEEGAEEEDEPCQIGKVNEVVKSQEREMDQLFHE